MTALNLPTEILLAITENLNSMKEINALARTNQHCYRALKSQLYLTASREDDQVILQAAKSGNPATMQNFIEAGALGTRQRIKDLLNFAASRGHVDTAMILIKRLKTNWKRKYTKRYCRNAMAEAIKQNQALMAETLITKKRVDLEVRFEDGLKAIHLAARFDSGDVIKSLFELGVDLYSLDEGNNSALQIAAIEGNLEAANALLSCGFDVNFFDGNGNAPIHGLAKVHSDWKSPKYERTSYSGLYPVTITKTLLEHGADPYLQDRYGATPLWIASCLDLKREVEILLEHGVNANGIDRDGNVIESMSDGKFKEMAEQNLFNFMKKPSRWNPPLDLAECHCFTPLCIATYMENLDIMEMLLGHGANPNIRHEKGIIPLHMAVKAEDGNKLYYQLIRKGASVHARDRNGRTALWQALGSAEVDIIKSLLEAGASLDCAAPDDLNPVFRALVFGHSDFERVELFPPGIVNTGDEKVFDHQHEWPHRCECCPNHDPYHECERVLELFLDDGTDVNARDPQGRTLLHQATFQNCEGSVKLLLSRGADPMAKDLFGQTPLHMACSDRWYSKGKGIIKLLLRAGCDPNSKDENGDTPLHMAARSSCTIAVRLFRLDGRAEFLARNNLGNTVLHESVGRIMSDTTTIVEVRRAGADFDLVNNDGKTVWDIARSDPEWEDYLLGGLECEIPEEESESDSSDLEDESEPSSMQVLVSAIQQGLTPEPSQLPFRGLYS